MTAKFVVHVEVTGKGSRKLTPEELVHAISFGLNWNHGHAYTKAKFKVEAQRVTDGVDTSDGGQRNA